jgi:2-methylisocitrate lyase-like PEP mutase family enzyme
VNVLMGIGSIELNTDELSEMGVKRVSVGSALSRAALGMFLSAAKEMREQGTFRFAKRAANTQRIEEMFGP